MKQRKPDRAYLIFYICTALICASLLIFRFSMNPITVVGTSMYPTYKDGEILSTIKFDESESTLEYDDIIVFFRDGHKRLIKRVVGLPGDTLQSVDGHLYRNGEDVMDGFPDMEDPGILSPVYTVPDGCVFVLGDNRNESTDSRVFGAVQYSSVVGIVDKTIIARD